MQTKKLYFVTDYQEPEFPIVTAEQYFKVKILSRVTDDFSWFDWNSCGCLVCETQNHGFAVSMVNALRMRWINLPTVWLSRRNGGLMHRTCFGPFSRVFVGGTNGQLLIRELIDLAGTDEIGTPSPLELRKRFGRLGNQERRVLTLSLQGQTSKEIAAKLGIRYQTVDKYRRNALQRMKAKNLVVLLRRLFGSIYRDW